MSQEQTHNYTREEVAQHNSPESLWLIINNNVVDVTDFLANHPGGEEVLLDMAGGDATTAFADVNHSEHAKKLVEKFTIGSIVDHPAAPEENEVEEKVSVQSEEVIAAQEEIPPVEQVEEVLESGDDSPVLKEEIQNEFAEAQANDLVEAAIANADQNDESSAVVGEPEDLSEEDREGEVQEAVVGEENNGEQEKTEVAEEPAVLEEDNKAPVVEKEETAEESEVPVVKEEAAEESEAPVAVKVVDKTTVYSMEELAKHDSVDDCWIAVNGKVVDVTAYLNEHPGGDSVLLDAAGTDASEQFEDVGHSEDAIESMEDFVVGVLARDPVVEPVAEIEPAVVVSAEENGEKEEKSEEPETRGLEVEPKTPTIVVDEEEKKETVIKSSSSDKQRDEKVKSDKKKIKKDVGIPWGLVVTGTIAVGIVGAYFYLRKKN
mmetsp:Transcript_117274/g.175120  ORF Transcript_117274/g.175120 Transcript_117274/m.175120 type:complete len:433 (+) Transcript_117274:3-1301(+)